VTPRTSRLFPLFTTAILALAACTTPPAQAPDTPATGRGMVRKGTPIEVNIAAARARGLTQAFQWEEWSAAAFEKARREKRYILLDGAAEWCHWCHVMDETTYVDPEVGRILRERFVTIRVDVDARPDIAERYGDWGWPATIIFTPEAEEIGKYRGYLAPAELIEILRTIEKAAAEASQAQGGTFRDPGDRVPPVEALDWVGARVALDMDDYYDPKEGGWGWRQKAPLGANAEFELVRYAHGDKMALKRAVLTLQKQRALIDPIWGGIYQYSAGSAWTDPHYEKLMAFQTSNLEAYARAYEATKIPAMLADAQSIEKYLSTFLMNKEGAFLVSQDADVGAHDAKKQFVDGDVYYRLDDAGRRALGIPRVDENVYGLENGLAIAALVTLYEVARDPAVLMRARRAADLLLRTHVTPEGAVRRPGKSSGDVRFLADAASFGRALARLAAVTGEAAYKEAAERIATTMVKDLLDSATGAFFSHTPDPAAAGVFTRRDHPFPYNVLAARFFGSLSRIAGESWRDQGRKTLAAISSPRSLDGKGRMVGEYLLALDEVGAFAW
jgi:hypothetical protein